MGPESQNNLSSSIIDIFAKNTAEMPKHVAIIMDGNRRWARGKKIPVFSGHKAGTKNIKDILEFLITLEINFLTLFTFSTENWERPQKEVNYITNTLLSESLTENFINLHKMGVKITIKGSTEKLNSKLGENIENAVKKTKSNNRINLIIAFDYGGRREIINATKNILKDKIKPSELDEDLFSEYMGAKVIPDPDLVIRTGGEYRLSNFLIWQSAYSEFYTSDVLWPDFRAYELSEALIEFSNRKRRFGKG